MPINSVTSKRTYEQLWNSRDTVGTTLLTLVLDSYGQEAFDMDPQALRQEIEVLGYPISRLLVQTKYGLFGLP
jgi:hypothetical protein